MLSSKARLAGFLPCAGVDLAFDKPLRLFPVVGQELIILVHRHKRIARMSHLEQPTVAVTVNVYTRRIVEQGAIEHANRPRNRSEKIGDGLRRFYVADLLQQFHGVAGADLPIEKVHVLHQANRVGRETEPARIVMS
jgi:hypothetical protein